MFEIFTKDGFIQLLYFLPALLLSLSVHEFAHAYVAYKLGDKSQKVLGRLTLAPFAHIDWTGFVSILLIGIGWGKPVMVDDRNFKKRALGNMLVAIAGAAANILLAITITIILKIIFVTGLYSSLFIGNVGAIVFYMLVLLIQFNIIFAVFNLIPLPPFDGSKVLYYFLPYKFKGYMEYLERYSLIILIFLIFTRAYVYVIGPAYEFANYLISYIIGNI